MVPMSNILQSEIWARFQESNGHTVIRRSGEGWSYIATVEGGKTGRYLYSPYGPVAEDAQTFDAALTSLLDGTLGWAEGLEPGDEAVAGSSDQEHQSEDTSPDDSDKHEAE